MKLFLRIHVTTLLLISSVALNVALSRKVTTLRDTIGVLKGEKNLKIGEVVPDLSVIALNGTPATVAYAANKTPTVLYVFTPTCSWCYRNLENIKALASGLKGRYRVIGVSLTDRGVAEYAAQHALPFEVYVAGAEVVQRYKLGGTPQTLVITPDGHVLKNWHGAFQGSLKTEIERDPGVSMPGLMPLPAQPAKPGI